jgi:hypothetical protein
MLKATIHDRAAQEGMAIASDLPRSDVDDPLDFDFIVDPDAEPIDLDEILLDFIERVVERRLAAHSTGKRQAG